MKKENPGSAPPADTQTSVRTPRALVEGRDYYLERGLMVFTAQFLRARGYCCESGCRHCPYSATEVIK
ncbi:MAG TPA: DUF5522 domain-containing protein [Pyrinomonadaceae bacterium]